MPGTTDPDLPDGIGPHEGQEFALMRAGQKNVALFFELEPCGLDDMLQDGFCLLQVPQLAHQGRMIFTRIVFRPGFAPDAFRLLHLIEAPSRGFDPKQEHEIGRILSYRPDQVETFLRHVQGDSSG